MASMDGPGVSLRGSWQTRVITSFMFMAAVALTVSITKLALQRRPSPFESCASLCASRFAIVLSQGDAKSIGGAVEAGLAFDAPDPKDVEEYAPILADELSIYPDSFLGSSSLKRIVLCRDFRIKGKTAAGGTCFGLRAVFLPPALVTYEHSADRRVKAIHHEIYHVIDYQVCKYRFRIPPGISSTRAASRTAAAASRLSTTNS